MPGLVQAAPDPPAPPPFSLSPSFSLTLNIALGVAGVIAGSAGYFTDMFGGTVAKEIVETAGFAAAIMGGLNAALHGYSSPRPGPMV